MTKPTDIAGNRTGIAVSPQEAKRALNSAAEGVVDASLEVKALHGLRLEYSRSAEPLGTLPPPMKARGKGKTPAIFLDLLGERLGYERTGARMYELLLVKLEAARPHRGGPRRGDLEHIRDDELNHFRIAKQALERLGADPTAITPSADASAVASSGLLQILSDPRTTLTEALQAVRMIELADNDAWVSAVRFAEELGELELAEQFREALEEEQDHLLKVRGWLDAAIFGQAGLQPPRLEEAEAPPPS